METGKVVLNKIADQHKIVTIRMDESLRPLELVINPDIFLKLDDENLARLVEVLIKKYSIEVFRNFDKLAADMYQFFQGIKKEIPESLITLSQDSGIRQLITSNLVATSLTGHGLRKLRILNMKFLRYSLIFISTI